MCITKRSFSCLHVQQITCLASTCTGKTVEWLMPSEDNCPDCVNQAQKANLKSSILNCTFGDVLQAISSVLNPPNLKISPATDMESSPEGEEATSKATSDKSTTKSKPLKTPSISGKFKSRNELKSDYSKMIMKRDAEINDLKAAIRKLGLDRREIDAELQEASNEREEKEEEEKAVRDAIKAEKAAKHAASMKEQEDVKQVKAAERKQKAAGLKKAMNEKEAIVLKNIADEKMIVDDKQTVNNEVVGDAKGTAEGQVAAEREAGQKAVEEDEAVWTEEISKDKAAEKEDVKKQKPGSVLSPKSRNANGGSASTHQGDKPVDNMKTPEKGAPVNRFAQKEAARASAAAARKLAGEK